MSVLINQVQTQPVDKELNTKKLAFAQTPIFKKLFLGIFLGTFAGLLIIGNIRIIGAQQSISDHTLVVGISLFAVANFAGRLIWGFLSDHIGASLSVFLALLFQSISIIALNIIDLYDSTYLVLSILIGFGFGGNFVLFAKETAQVFGLERLGIIYPYVFIGYAIAGIVGPLSGGVLYNITGAYFWGISLAGFMSLLGSLLFLNQFMKERKNTIIEKLV